MANQNETFHFCQESPPEDFYTTIQLINKLNEQQYQDLLDRLYLLMSNSNIITDIISNLQLYSNENNLDLENVKEMIKVLLIICREARKHKLTAGQLYSDMQKLKLIANRASILCQIWKKSLCTDTTSAEPLEKKHLLDMEWKFGVTASSSEIERVGNCYLQLKMVVAKGSSSENVFMELSLSQFYEFMHEMERAKLELQSIL